MLNLDSSTNQTKAIMKRHSQYAKKGITPEYDLKYQEAMKCLKRVKVKIPFAEIVDKFFPEKSIMMRTNYPRFLDFIKASASFHQYQRSEEEDFILAEGQDYDIARECFLKLCSNKYMINLTINQKKILDVFEEGNGMIKGSVTQLHPRMNFISIPALQTNLGILTKYNILNSYIDNDSYGRDMEIYELAEGYNPNEKIDIPTYVELLKHLKQVKHVNQPKHLKQHPINLQRDVKDVKDVKPILYTNNAKLNVTYEKIK